MSLSLCPRWRNKIYLFILFKYKSWFEMVFRIWSIAFHYTASPLLHCTAPTILYPNYFTAPTTTQRHCSIAFHFTAYTTLLPTAPLHCTLITPLRWTNYTAPPLLLCTVQCYPMQFTSTVCHCTLLHGEVLHLIIPALHCSVQCSTLNCISQNITRTALYCNYLQSAVLYIELH